MSRYEAMFRRSGNGGVFGAFVMLGDPDLESCPAILDQLVEGGADMIEVGIPFSDPVADGPVIQAAGVRALANGAGSNSENSVGTGVIGGMLTATFLAPFLIPMFYVVVSQKLGRERRATGAAAPAASPISPMPPAARAGGSR